MSFGDVQGVLVESRGGVLAKGLGSESECGPSCSMNAFCGSLSSQSRRVLCQNARRFGCERGGSFRVRELGQSMVVISSGVIVSGRENHRGRTISFGAQGPGQVINLMSIANELLGYPEDWNSDHWGFVVDAFEGCVVPRRVFVHLSKSDPAFDRLVIACLVERYRTSVNYLLDMQQSDSVGKIRLFMESLQRQGGDISELSHEVIARLLDMNRVTVTRAMGRILREK